MPRLFWPAGWLFIGAGAIMLLAAFRYQWRVWWPFPSGLLAVDEQEPSTRWIDRLRRRRRLRRARRAEDLAQTEALRRRWQAIDRVLQMVTLARIAQGIAILVTSLALWGALELPTDVTTATLWSWEPASDLHVALTYRVDDLGRWLTQVALAVAFLVFVAHALSRERAPRTRDYAWGLVALGAFINMVLCLDLIAFLASWVILDVGLFMGLAGVVKIRDARILIVGVAMSMVVTVALLWAILMVGPFGGTLLFTRASPILMEDRVLGMFLLAAVFRLMLYPFHLRFRQAAEGSPPLAALGHVLPLMAGFYLLTRLYALASGEMPGLGGVQVLAVLSLVAGAVLIWRHDEPRGQISYAFLSQAGGLVLVLTLGSPEAITATLVGLVGLVLAASALFLQVDHPAPDRIGRVLLLVPLASLAGIPPLLGFWGRWMSYNVALEWGQPGMMLLTLVCHVSVTAALLRTLNRQMRWDTSLVFSFPTTPSLSRLILGGRKEMRKWLRYGTLGLLILPLVLLGLWPPAMLTGLRAIIALVAGVPEPTLSITALSPTADALTPWIALGGLLLSLGAILWLGGWPRLPRVSLSPSHATGDRWQRTATRLYEVLDLAWAHRLGWDVFVGLSRLLAGLMSVLDGHYALAWIILLGFAIGLFLLGSGNLP